MQLRKRLDQKTVQEEEDELSTGNENTKDRTAVLAIAYHNMGVEQEFLRSYPAAILSYKKAVNFAEKNLGVDDGITQNLRNVYENAKNELDLTVFKKKKGTTTSGSGNMAAGLKGSKYLSMGPQGKQKKQVVQRQQDGVYENMITPRNVSTIFISL